MSNIATALTMAAFLSLIVNRLTEALVLPLFERYKWDKFWLMYAAWGVSGVLVALTSIDVLHFIPWTYPIVGKILTAVIAGGGANFLHDLFDGLLTISESFKELLRRSSAE